MNKKNLCAMAFGAASTLSINAQATLASNAVLQFASGTGVCTNGMTYPNCYNSANSSSSFTVTSGSYFGIDANFDGELTGTERTAMTLLNGIYINSAQTAYGSNYDQIIASASIDTPFYFYGAYGIHHTTSPISILSDDGTGHVTLDFSGWQWFWNGSFVQDNNPSATLLCSNDCSLGDTFTLDYTMLFTSGAVLGLPYHLHLEGVISAVPAPAALWLFGSGLIGLIGFSHKRKIIL